MGSISSRSPSPKCTPTGDKEFPTLLHVYYALARSLHRGDGHRPGLPAELLSEIFRHAVILQPGYSNGIGWSWEFSPLAHSTAVHKAQPEAAQALPADRVMQRKLLFSTNEIAPHTLRKMAVLGLETHSMDQSGVSDPNVENWSWYEMGIMATSISDYSSEQDVVELDFLGTWPSDPPTNHIRDEPSWVPEIGPTGQKQLSWPSHHNTLTSRVYTRFSGEEWGPDHEIWRNLKPGDRLGVWSCGKSAGWQCITQEATIKVREWFEPTFL